MARKNIFGIQETGAAAKPAAEEADTDIRPLANFEKRPKRASPVGALSQSLGGINEKAQRAADLERQLAQGQTIVDLDPALVDSSFVPDRLGVAEEEQQRLVTQIREHGQQVPILVRPHPEAEGRYQVAYGHRRLAAVRELGLKARAVVRDLTDEQLVVSQGQENNARTDLSFVERSFFAHRLEERGFSRDVIMASLGVDKAALSRMIALVERLPVPVIEAIGPAPGFGRTRWAEMADLLGEASKKAKALKLVATPAFLEKNSDDRFDYLFDQLRKAKDKPRTAVWRKQDGAKAVRISETDERLSLIFDKATAADFGAYVESRLDALYAAFEREKHTGD
ncbi:MAG: plasmid partitioning protein RepB [Rhizobiales bacterium 63-7]|nr:plasmid partitioning protein RepB [Hyphomicrobiales bacterium]OJU71742.1 MAG: plasmid partitioning protein RepB [Rhizobiales bacterium 63-7]